MEKKNGFACCSQCGKQLVPDIGTDAAIGVDAVHAGHLYKFPILFTGKDERHLFCGKECNNAYFAANVPRNPELEDKLAEIRRGIPEASKQIAESAARFMAALKSLQKKK